MDLSYRKVEYKHTPFYFELKESDWNDWKWQLKNAIRDINTLKKVIDVSEAETEQLMECLKKFKMAVTPYYICLMDKKNKRCPIRLQGIPRIEELYIHESDMNDPLHEDVDSPTPGLTHRYPDRVLLLVTKECSMYCRHCTRRRTVGCDESGFNKVDFLKSVEYIRSHREVRDVVVSGGDPLILEDEKIDFILKTLKNIDSVEIIRIGTRTPIVLPQRITDNLVNVIKKYHPVYVNTHFNHPDEITEDSRAACIKLAEAGIPIGNQSVLLKDVNDCPLLMKKLVRELLKIRVKPYSIYQCDLSMGISHFRTSVGKGIEIIENLRGHTSGLAVPVFLIDAPGGGGKIPLMPNYVLSQSDKRVVLRNYMGKISVYTSPENTKQNSCKCNICKDKFDPALDHSIARMLAEE